GKQQRGGRRGLRGERTQPPVRGERCVRDRGGEEARPEFGAEGGEASKAGGSGSGENRRRVQRGQSPPLRRPERE
ncbi:hypothetical protein ACHAWF_013150, partial [Thalassiosira exigua]